MCACLTCDACLIAHRVIIRVQLLGHKIIRESWDLRECRELMPTFTASHRLTMDYLVLFRHPCLRRRSGPPWVGQG